MNVVASANGKKLLETIIQFIRKKYFTVFLFNFLLRLIIKLPIYFYNRRLATIDHFARIAIAWYIGLPLGELRQFIFMPLLIRIFSLNFLIDPFIVWLIIDIMGFSIGLAVVFHLLDKRIEEWEIRKPENFLELYIFSNLLFPISYLKWNSTYGLLLMLVSLTIYFIFEDKLQISLIFAVLSALTHFFGWAIVSMLILYAYKDRRYLLFIIPSFFVLLQFYHFYIITGDFFLYFHAQNAFWGYSFFPISFPFNTMLLSWNNLTKSLYLAIMYISQLLCIAIIISYLYYYIKNKHIDRLNLIIFLYFILLQMIDGTRPRDLSRFSVLILPFCAILILIRFMEDVNTKKLKILIAILSITNIILIWYMTVADVLKVSSEWEMYERLSRYLKKRFLD